MNNIPHVLSRIRIGRTGALVCSFVAAICFLDGAGGAAPPPAVGHHAGITYSHDEVKEIPWSVHIVKVDRQRTDFQWLTTMGQGGQLGMGIVSEQVKAVRPALGRPVAAINGDFFRNSKNNPGDPDGLQIIAGELVSAPVSSRSCFWIDDAGAPHIGTVSSNFKVTWPDGSSTPFGLNEERSGDNLVLYTSAIGSSTRAPGSEIVLERGGADAAWLPLQVGCKYLARVREVNSAGNSAMSADTLVLSGGPALSSKLSSLPRASKVTLSTATTPDIGGARTAIGGGPALVRGGKAVPFKGIQPRHPRSALGWNDSFYFLVEVDGRQRVSAGMSLPELAGYLAKLGCTEALNLDGGGSATLWVYGGVINSPSEGHERPAANALVLVQQPGGTNSNRLPR